MVSIDVVSSELPDSIREQSLRLSLSNLAFYLRQGDIRTMNFAELRDLINRLEQDRNALYFKQGSR